MLGEHLDVSSDSPVDGAAPAAEVRAPRASARPFVGIHFTCCDVYSRIYINRDATAYEGYCPRCLGRVMVRASTDGSNDRFFSASLV